MKLKRLNGALVTIRINPAKYPIRSREQSRSRGQFNLGKKLRLIYTTASILEEFSIPGSRLSLDFFIPSRNLAFEFQGIQHDKFNSFFHETKADFQRQRSRDADKLRWCQMNEITLIEVRDKDMLVRDLRSLITETMS